MKTKSQIAILYSLVLTSSLLIVCILTGCGLLKNAPEIKGHWTSDSGLMMDFPTSGSSGTFTYTSKFGIVASGKWDIREKKFDNDGTSFILYNLDFTASGQTSVFSIDYKEPDVGERGRGGLT